MLFNLGLAADAAAAHEHESLGSPSETPLASATRHSSPSISFATLPSWGLGGIYGRSKAQETEMPQQRTMPPRTVAIEPASSSDEERSTVGSVLAPSKIGRSQSVRKQSSRPKTSYQLAHPAAHARHRRLKLRPKLLLQLQQVSQTPRPLPVLDVLPSTVFLPRLARKFPTIFRGKKGLGPNDLVVVASDLYDSAPGNTADRYPGSDDESGEREVVATICQLFKDDALSKGKAEICLNHGPVWEATPLANGCYEFVANTDHGVQVLRWVLRGAKTRRVSAPPGNPMQEDTKRFTFSVINPNTRRHPVIATMSRNYLEVYDEYSMPTNCGLAHSPNSAMSVISDSSEIDDLFDRKVMVTDKDLRMLIVITSIWVAFREGWSHNFGYDDTAAVLNTKALCSSRQSSPTAGRNETDKFPEMEVGQPADIPALNGPRRHRLSSATYVSTQTIIADRPTSYGSLSKRSNSTGAAFIERTNRRASSSNNRLNRHSALATPRERSQDETETTQATPARQDSKSRRIWPHSRKSEDLKRIVPPDQEPDRSRGLDNPRASRPVEPSSLEKSQPEPAPTKGKRRHRISSLFDFIIRKNGHSH